MEDATPRVESASRIVALVVTNLTKLAGLYVGINELGNHGGNPHTIVLAYSALLIAGGQVSETAILGFIERFFTGTSRKVDRGDGGNA